MRIPFWLEVTGWIVLFILAPFSLVLVPERMPPQLSWFLFLFSMSLIGILSAGALCYFLLQQLTGKDKHFKGLFACGMAGYFLFFYLSGNYWMIAAGTVTGYLTGYMISAERKKKDQKQVTSTPGQDPS